MPTKKRRKKIRREEESSDSGALWEWQIPLALLIVGFVTVAVGAFSADGPGGTAGAMVGVVLYLVLDVPLTIAAMYVVASFLGISFGFLNTAILKLAGITLFTLGLNVIGDAVGFPILGGLLAVIATYFLFSYCFYLEVMETILAVVSISVVLRVLTLMVAAIVGAIFASATASSP
jgi:hypothetical protein